MTRKVLLCQPTSYYQGAAWTGDNRFATQYMKTFLSSLGYVVEERPLEDTSTFADSLPAGAYEFVVFPHLRGSGWTTWTSGAGKPVSRFVKGQTPIPVFALGVDQNANALMLANVGAGAIVDSAVARKTRWRDCDWYTVTASFAVTVQAHMTQYRVLQTDATGANPVAWRYRGENGWVYVQGSQQYQGLYHGLPLLLVEAIEAGHIAPPPRKIQVVIDLDDMPDASVSLTSARIADCERVYAAQQRMRMPSTWGLQPNYLGNRIGADIRSFIRDRTVDRGGLLYPIVHSGLWFWKDGTKATKDSTFKADIATAVANGYRVGWTPEMLDQWGYFYANNNAYDQETFELASPETAIWCDPNNTVPKPGYGWMVARLDQFGGNNSEGYGVPRISTIGQRANVRGIRFIGSHTSMSSAQVSLDFDDGSTGSAVAANHWARVFCEAGVRRCAVYIHGSNCWDGHDGGNAPGTRWLESLADLYQAGMHMVVEYVHGAALVGSPA